MQLSASSKPTRPCRITVSPSYEDDLNTAFNSSNHDADDASHYRGTLNAADEMPFFADWQAYTCPAESAVHSNRKRSSRNIGNALRFLRDIRLFWQVFLRMRGAATGRSLEWRHQRPYDVQVESVAHASGLGAMLTGPVRRYNACITAVLRLSPMMSPRDEPPPIPVKWWRLLRKRSLP